MRIILFDGRCSFCTGAVLFILRHDKRAVFHFAAAEKPAGQRLCQLHNLPSAPGSVVLLDDKGVHLGSEAVLRIAAGLGGVWRMASLLRIVPLKQRDALYRAFARRRYRWFGRCAAGTLPTATTHERFLDS